MTTKLDSPVTRLTTLVVDGREVDVTLVPGDAAMLKPEALELHQKGLRDSVVIPLPVILKGIGWKVQTKKGEDMGTFEKIILGKRVTEEEFDAAMRDLEEALKPWKQN